MSNRAPKLLKICVIILINSFRWRTELLWAARGAQEIMMFYIRNSILIITTDTMSWTLKCENVFNWISWILQEYEPIYRARMTLENGHSSKDKAVCKRKYIEEDDNPEEMDSWRNVQLYPYLPVQHSKRNTLTRWWFTAGPASRMVVERQTSVVLMCCVYWVMFITADKTMTFWCSQKFSASSIVLRTNIICIMFMLYYYVDLVVFMLRKKTVTI